MLLAEFLLTMSARSGVVQRRNVATKESVGAVKEKEENLNGDPEEDLDSKETRLTLMEETLLLGLKDREVFVILSKYL